MRSSTRHDRRGVAMLLVIISLMMATILTMAYVSSRDNSGVIGANVASSAAARWAAESGLDMGVAVLETQSDWRTASAGGKLLDDYPLANGTIDIDLLDLETGTAPTANTQNVKLTSTAMVAGVQQIATAVAYVPVSANTGADVDLSEFAAFAASKIAIADSGTITRWPASPLSALGRPISIGVQNVASASVTIDNSGAPIDTKVLLGPGASGSAVSISNTMSVTKSAILDTVPMPTAPDSGVAAPLLPTSPLSMSGTNSIVSTSRRYSKMTITNAAKLELRGTINAVSDGDIVLQNKGKIYINGNVKLVSFGKLTLQDSSIELAPGASLTMYVADAIDMQDGYVGENRTVAVRDNSGKAAVIDPDRIKVYRLPAYVSAVQWRLRDNTVVKASIYAPNVQFLVRDTSALYGRVAADTIQIREEGVIFYNPAMDTRNGYTEPTSQVFKADGHIQDAIKTLTSLNATALQLVANLTGVRVKGIDSALTIIPVGEILDVPPAVLPTDPTPRPIPVQYTITAYGTDVNAWEQH